MHGFAFEKVFGGEGVACTEGDLVANKDKLGGSIEEERLTTILLEGRFQPLCGAQSAMDTGLILVHKDLLAGLQNIVRELVLLPQIHVEGAASVPGPSAGFGNVAGQASGRGTRKHLWMFWEEAWSAGRAVCGRGSGDNDIFQCRTPIKGAEVVHTNVA